MLTTIVIVNYKAPELEKRCLASVRRYTSSAEYRLAVVDNSVENRPLAEIWDEEFDQAFASGSESAVLLNTDCFVTQNWLTWLKAVLVLDKEVGAVGPVTNACGNTFQLVDRVDPNGGILVNHPLSAFCMLIRAEAWRAVGGFPRGGPFYGQDTAFVYRLLSNGWKTAIVPRCFVTHLGSASLKAAEMRGEANMEGERRMGEEWYRRFTQRGDPAQDTADH